MDLLLVDGFWGAAGRFLWHEETRTVVVADLHLGFEREMGRRGNFMPEFTRGPMGEAWGKVMERGPRRVIVAGDVFHASEPEDETVGEAREMFGAAAELCEVVVMRGNHDPAEERFKEIFWGTGSRVEAEGEVGGWVVRHGDQLEGVRERDLIVGHQHPAVILGDRVQSVKMICFGVVRREDGRRGGRMILLPAFSTAPLGSNLLTSRNWNLDVARPGAQEVRVAGIVKDRVLDFGMLGDLRS